MWSPGRSIATLLVVVVIGGLLPVPALAHRMFERVQDPSTGDSYRQEASHRHRADGSVVVYDDTAYDTHTYSRPYSTYYSAPYYSSSYYRPYGYSDYSYRRGGSSIGPALLGAGIGYAIGRNARR